MNIAKERAATAQLLEEYRRRIDAIPDEQFELTPPDGGWSYAEVYSHILNGTLGSFIAMERCANVSASKNSGRLTLLGKLVLFFGRFPPVKIKVPEAVLAKMPVTKITKEQARNLLIKCRKKFDDTAQMIKSASPHSRHKHPRLGMLNAGQWLKFIRIHAQHHLKQIDRIENNFRSS